mgnify:FL=1
MHSVNIQISVNSTYPAHDPRNGALREWLAAHAFAIAEKRGGWLAVSHDGEGSELKRALRAAGFADRDYQIRVEYQRAWGFL